VADRSLQLLADQPAKNLMCGAPEYGSIEEKAMLTPLPDLGAWPELDWPRWQATAETLHMCMQIVGKTRLALTPLQNHWWNTTFHLTARGLTAAAMPIGGGEVLDIEFDLLSHAVVCRSSRGVSRSIALSSVSVAQFFNEFLNTLARLGVEVRIDRMPVEVEAPIRCDLDTVHCTYDEEAVTRFWRALRIADALLKRFSTNFYGKVSPVHFFWGSLDLAVTRFNGRKAPARPGMDAIQAEAYSHEVISAGFWPGNGGYGQAAFYAYAAPVPEGLDKTTLHGRGRFDRVLGEFILDYDDARSSPDSVDTVLEFLQETYSAAASAARWDRPNLDRSDEVATAVRLKNPQQSAAELS
jgi:Family of unknown function (DUF5996)